MGAPIFQFFLTRISSEMNCSGILSGVMTGESDFEMAELMHFSLVRRSFLTEQISSAECTGLLTSYRSLRELSCPGPVCSKSTLYTSRRIRGLQDNSVMI